MRQQILALKTLHLVDGNNLAEAFDHALMALAKDCMGRPGIDKARTLKLVVSLTPQKKDDGTCDDVIVKCHVEAKEPAFSVSSYKMRGNVNGALKFQPDSPLEPDQSSLDFGDES